MNMGKMTIDPPLPQESMNHSYCIQKIRKIENMISTMKDGNDTNRSSIASGIHKSERLDPDKKKKKCLSDKP